MDEHFKVLAAAKALLTKFEVREGQIGIHTGEVMEIYSAHFGGIITERQGDFFIMFVEKRGHEFYSRDMTFVIADMLLMLLAMADPVGTLQ